MLYENSGQSGQHGMRILKAGKNCEQKLNQKILRGKQVALITKALLHKMKITNNLKWVPEIPVSSGGFEEKVV